MWAIAGAISAVFASVVRNAKGIADTLASLAEKIGMDEAAAGIRSFADGMDSAAQAATAFSETAAEEIEDASKAGLDYLARGGEQVAESVAEIPKTFAEKIEASREAVQKTLNGYRLSAESSTETVRDVVGKIMSTLHRPEQFAALKQELNLLGLRVKLSAEQQAALAAKSVEHIEKTAETAGQAVKRLYTEQEAAAEQAQKKLAEETAQVRAKPKKHGKPSG